MYYIPEIEEFHYGFEFEWGYGLKKPGGKPEGYNESDCPNDH